MQQRKQSKSGSIRKILRPGKLLTDKNIDHILAANTGKMNIYLVKELVKNLKLRNVDSKDRNKALCDVQNVCRIILHLQNKIGTEESKLAGSIAGVSGKPMKCIPSQYLHTSLACAQTNKAVFQCMKSRRI